MLRLLIAIAIVLSLALTPAADAAESLDGRSGDEWMVQPRSGPWGAGGPFQRVMVEGPAEGEGNWRVESPGVAVQSWVVTSAEVSGQASSSDPRGIAAFYLDAVHRCARHRAGLGDDGFDMRWVGPTSLVYLLEAKDASGDRWLVSDAVGHRLVVDVAKGVIEAASDDRVLPPFYAFCPEDLFVGLADH